MVHEKGLVRSTNDVERLTQNSQHFCEGAQWFGSTVQTPLTKEEGQNVSGGVWRGRESFCRWWQCPSLSRTHLVMMTEVVPLFVCLQCIFSWLWHKFYPGDHQNGNSGFTVVRGSVAPMPLWSQNCVHDVRMSCTRCQGGWFRMRRGTTKSERRGGTSAPVGGSCWVPKHKF